MANLSKDLNMTTMLSKNVNVLIEHIRDLLIANYKGVTNLKKINRESFKTPIFSILGQCGMYYSNSHLHLTIKRSIYFDKKAIKEGIDLTLEEANLWIAKVNSIFPSLITAIQQIGEQFRKENTITTLVGTQLPLKEIPPRIHRFGMPSQEYLPMNWYCS